MCFTCLGAQGSSQGKARSGYSKCQDEGFIDSQLVNEKGCFKQYQSVKSTATLMTTILCLLWSEMSAACLNIELILSPGYSV